jgi:hypothetical protein
MQTNKIKAEHLKKEAQRLLEDQVLIHALEGARQEALEKLATEKDRDNIPVLQGEVQAYNNFKDKLSEYILAQ